MFILPGKLAEGKRYGRCSYRQMLVLQCPSIKLSPLRPAPPPLPQLPSSTIPNGALPFRCILTALKQLYN